MTEYGADGEAILGELRRVDETTLHFSPWGLGGRLEPEASARFLSESLTYAAIADVVPEDVRLNFERVRKIFLYGLLEYDFFSVASDLAHLVLEGALRHRFVTYYQGQVPVWRNGSSDVLTVASFDHYYDALAASRTRRERIRLREEPTEILPRGYAELYAWARRRGLLVGQRNVGVFGSLVRLRNWAAHPERHSIDMPPDVIPLLRDVAEIINRLWGRDTEGGRLFPTPVARRPRAAALSPDGQAAVTFGSLALVPAERGKRDWTYAVFLAADGEELIDFDWENPGRHRFLHTPGFQMTQYPCELLWGSGSQDDLVAGLASFDDQKPVDAVPFLDRTFYIRVAEAASRPDFPRSPADLSEYIGVDPSAVWFAIVADFPMDAWVLVRDSAERLVGGSQLPPGITRLTGDAEARRHAATHPTKAGSQ